MFWLPEKPTPQLLIPNCAFKINPDPERMACSLHVAHLHGELWLVDNEAAYPPAEGLPLLCEATIVEGVMFDGETFFLLPVLYPLWNPGEWSDSLWSLARLAHSEWVTVVPDVANACFQRIPNAWKGPERIAWPTGNFAAVVERAFGGRYIGADFAQRNRAFRELLVERCDRGEKPMPPPSRPVAFA